MSGAAVVTVLISSAFVYKTYVKGVDVASMDQKASPRTDFFEYANGKWVKENPVPATEGRWSAFNVLAERNNELLRQILENASISAAPRGTVKYKIGTFYRLAMDSVRLNTQGTSGLTDHLNAINEIKNTQDLMQLMAYFHQTGISAMFNFDVSQDVKNSTRYAPYLSQGGLGLPDRDYYFKTDEKSNKIKNEYRTYMSNLMRIAGFKKEDQQMAATIFRMEIALAEMSMTRVERRDMEKQYNKMSYDDLKQMTPNIPWDPYFTLLNINSRENLPYIIVSQPNFFSQLNRLFVSYSLDDWKNYLRYKVVASTAGYLSDPLVSEHFRFYGTALTGTTEQKPRWKRAVNQANSMIGELVAEEYVKIAFSEDSKKRVNEMVDNLREAFRMRIEKLDWMSAETKKRALEKLQSFTRKLGYPDKWTPMESLAITDDFYVRNYFSASTFWHRYMLNKLGKQVDRSEWEMLPQTVNAYYNPVNNEIVFPAAIMQPPFFDAQADDAVNYGAIGAVIGHEFSHGFDDQGSKFDAQGNMNNWWTEEDRAKFDARTKILVQQFNGFCTDSVCVNGELTLGENIADFAGLTVAYDAYQMSLKGKERKKIDGFTPEQRFFIGFAQVWRTNTRPEYLRQQVMTDPHAPGRYRVLGPLSNMPQFYQAFGVKKGDKMYRDDAERVKIW